LWQERTPYSTIPKNDEIAKSEWSINKTFEATFIQLASRTLTENPAPVAATPTPAATATTPPFGWMAMNIQLQLMTNEMKNWFLLDTGSTVHVFCNNALVKNIRNAQQELNGTTNAGTFKCKQLATLPWSGIDFWFDPRSITNVLNFGLLQAQYHITYDNNSSDLFIVHTDKGPLTFKRLDNQLYVFKPVLESSIIPMSTEDPINSNLLNTLEENKGFYTKRQIARAQAARNFSRALGCPSDNNLRAIIRSNSVRDCPILENDVKLAEQIFSQ
jgi:hypothetical protein